MSTTALRRFVEESNRIEGIHREPTERELDAHGVLLALDNLTVSALEDFVRDVAEADLRRELGMNVYVGSHTPPAGGPGIRQELELLLADVNLSANTPYALHVRYEQLHPFMDGNGRSGRAVWLWQMYREQRDPCGLPFLHRFYYQALDAASKEIDRRD